MTFLANKDRHLGNFGVIRNLDTLKWESVCPVFDTGRRFNTNISEKYWLDELVDVKFFTHHFITSDNISKVFSIPISHQQIKEMYKLVNLFQELLVTYQRELPIQEDDIFLLRKSFEKRVALFEKIMSDKDLIRF